jgi:hypothetical protein
MDKSVNTIFTKLRLQAILIGLVALLSVTTSVNATSEGEMRADSRKSGAKIHALTAVGHSLQIITTNEKLVNKHALEKNKGWSISSRVENLKGKSVTIYSFEPKKRDLMTELNFQTPNDAINIVLFSGPSGAKRSEPIILQEHRKQKQSVSAPTAIEISLEKLEGSRVSQNLLENSNDSKINAGLTSGDESKKMNANGLLPNKASFWRIKSGESLCGKIKEWAFSSGWQLSCEADAQILGEMEVEPELLTAINQTINAVGADKFKVRIYKLNKMIRITDYQ